MIYKISPRPSLPVYDRKRITKEGERKGRNDPLDYVKSLKCFDAPDGLN